MGNCCPALATCGELLDAKLLHLFLSEFLYTLIENFIMDYGESLMGKTLNPIYNLIVIML